MKLLFLSIGDIPSIRHHEIYPDLLRAFQNHGHEVFVVSSREKRTGLPTELIEEDGAKLLRVRIGNITKTNMIEKGISTVLVGRQYRAAIRKYFPDEKFDLIMYSTPPITLVGVVANLKKRCGAKTYLLLKDIFPQNAADIGLLPKSGPKGLLFKHFRRQEKQLYRVSDRIGCMSQANADYVIRHNPEVDPGIVEVCPNSIEVLDKSVDAQTRAELRKKYGIPLDKRVFVYGGNLGKPQGIPFLIECLKQCRDTDDAFFLIVGDGTEYGVLEEYFKTGGQENFKLMRRLPKEDYDAMVGACDVGLIFLDYRFTIPNFPSRLLAYMQAKLPILTCTDPNTDIGTVAEEGGFGSRCESADSSAFAEKVAGFLRLSEDEMKTMGERAFTYLNEHYTSEESYRIIMKDRTSEA